MVKFNKKNLIGIILFIVAIIVITFFDKVLAIGIIFIAFLTAITFLILFKTKMKNKAVVLLFLIALLIHLGAVLFIHYANFQPFGGGYGDYILYQEQAEAVAQRISQGNFSLEGLCIGHYYPVIIGYIYAFTIPEMLIGQLFNVWLVALLVVFAYLIVQEIGGSEKQGFLVGLIVTVYPSLLFYGSLLLKDALVVLLCLIGLLLMLKLIQRFSWCKFLLFYIILICLIHLRFYVGYSLLLSLIPCWLLFSNLKIKKRMIYAVIIILLLGFLPEIIAGQGYYGIKFLKQFLTPETITYYRETAYNPVVQALPSAEVPPTGLSSSFEIDVGFSSPLRFLKNSLKSFTYSLFGPFPWQMRRLRHLFALSEVLPWYFLFFFIIKGAVKSIRCYRVILPLIIFSLMLLCVSALFINNFGIITRIRIPVFISLLCFVPFGINWGSDNRIVRLISKNLGFLTESLKAKS